MSEPMRQARWLKTAATVGVVAITAGSWWLSFTALVRAAGLIGLREAGGPNFDAYVWAGLIDAFVGLGTLCLVIYRQESRKPVYPTIVLAIFGTATVAWNAALAPHQDHVPELVVRVGWGMPPAAMFMAWHLLISLLWPHERAPQPPPPVTEPATVVVTEPLLDANHGSHSPTSPVTPRKPRVTLRAQDTVRLCEGCGEPLDVTAGRRQKFHNDACKQRAFRARSNGHAERNGSSPVLTEGAEA